MLKTVPYNKISPVDATQSVEDIVKNSIRNILACLGDDPDREGLKNTPDRVYRAMKEVFKGMEYTNEEIAKMCGTVFEDVKTGDLVAECNIPMFSMCEHHLLPMYNAKVHVGYIPNGKVIGLSKIARIVELVSSRLQLQERIGMEVADILEDIVDTKDVIVVIEGEHACMTMRGIKKPGTVTRTACLRGKFNDDYQLRQEFYNLIK